MTNGLRDHGLLDEGDMEWVRRQNAHANLAYTDPSTVVADCYDPRAGVAGPRRRRGPSTVA
ncbi:hypothetical protein [Brachybacterium sp. AOP29-B2-41]|uniref:hypothetical protein n=1 Tax=Brachybacterium sp. AOP29-B2-41 TaxID=3457704 RepID=UPI004034F6D6